MTSTHQRAPRLTQRSRTGAGVSDRGVRPADDPPRDDGHAAQPTGEFSVVGRVAAASMLPAGISAVLPAFNEQAVVGDVVRRTHRALLDSGVPSFEIIVVDDGSRDGTGAEVQRVAAEYGQITLVRHPRNRGYGAALRTGFERASLEVIWLLDADGQLDPADLPRLLGAWREDALVAGYRMERRDPMLRRLNHDAFFMVVRATLGLRARDVNCAFKLIPRGLVGGLRSDGAMISTELVLRALDDRVPLVEVAVPHHPRTTGQPTGARPAVVLRAFAELAELAEMRRRRRR